MAKLKRDLTVEQQLARGPVDMPFLMLVVLLTGFGVIMVFSASYATAFYSATSNYSPTFYFFKQLRYAALGMLALFLASKFDYEHWRLLSVLVLSLAVVLLILVFPLGYGRETVGSQRWIRIPVFGSFQPSEIAKLGVILYFSARLSKRNRQKSWLRRKFSRSSVIRVLDRIGFLELLPYGAILAVIAYLMMKEPHMSGTILILAGAGAVLFAAGIKIRWFVIGIGGMGALVMLMMSGYQNMRIEVWKDPWAYPRDGGFQIIQSLYAIGSGGLLGLGLGKSVQKLLYLPEPENDFIFPIICEELGLVGAAVVLILFALLIIRGYWIAIHARDRFGTLLVVGITTLLAVQVFLNIAVVTNLLPTTGISLPFFSFGGTALIMQLGEMGIVLAVSRQISPRKQG